MAKNIFWVSYFIIVICIDILSFINVIPNNIATAVTLMFAFTLMLLISKTKKQTNELFTNFADKIQSLIRTSNELSLESHYLFDSSNAQSDAIQESASSIEETSSMAEQTAIQTKQSSQIAKEINTFAQEGEVIMKELDQSIEAINQINNAIANIKNIFEKVSDKTRMIDEIVFNTKLLSFNASIEAERAGTHGAGFSVVAQEIGKLANNSGIAAKDIRLILSESKNQVESIITDTKEKFERGKTVSSKAIKNFTLITEKINQMAQSFDSIASATTEQEIGIKQISKSITQVDLSASENVKVAHSTELLSAKIEDSLNELIAALNDTLTIFNIDHKQLGTTENFIEWTDELVVGINQIDQQHQQLATIVNELFRAIKSGKTTKILNEIFDRLIQYTASHFATEEKLFADTDYQETEEHIKHHKKLVESALKLQKDFKSGNAVIGREVMEFLKDWLLNHIAKVDKKYSEHFHKNGIR